jgi:hypothetical protein
MGMGFYPPAVSIPVEVKAEHPSERRADEAGELPEARLLDAEPTDTQVRWTMRLVWFMLIVLVLVCAIGPHIPAGE